MSRASCTLERRNEAHPSGFLQLGSQFFHLLHNAGDFAVFIAAQQSQSRCQSLGDPLGIAQNPALGQQFLLLPGGQGCFGDLVDLIGEQVGFVRLFRLIG